MFENKFRKLLIDKGIQISEFANMRNISQPNFSQQLKKDNFREKDMRDMADLLDCDIEITIRDRKTGNEY